MGKIYKALLMDGQISASVIDSTDIVQTAIDFHKLSPLAAAALGRTLTAAVFMASGLKNERDKLSITIDGNGEGGQMVVCADSSLRVRGYIDNPSVNLPLNAAGKLDVAGCVGKKGKISVVKSMGLKEPYTGCCHIVSGEIAEDFAAYYTYSEQQPTGMALGVRVGKDLNCAGAGGVVFQAMPNASDEALTYAEELLGHFSNVSSMIENTGAKGIIEEYFKDVEFTEREAVYKCDCSKEFVERILLLLGRDELYKIIEQEGQVRVVCHFCPENYVFSKDDVDRVLSENEQ